MTSSEKIKVALLDAELLFRQGLELIVSEAANIEVVISCEDGSCFFEQLALLSELPDIVLLDVRMKPMDGFEVVERLSIEYPEIKTIVLSSYSEKAFFGHMVKLGVAAFLPKNSSQSLLHEAILKVFQNGVFFTEQDHRMMTDSIRSKTSDTYFKLTENLTNREIEVLRYICDEQTNQAISELMFISKRTVENHRLRIIEKLGVKNTAGLVIYAITHGLYEPNSKYYF